MYFIIHLLSSALKVFQLKFWKNILTKTSTTCQTYSISVRNNFKNRAQCKMPERGIQNLHVVTEKLINKTIQLKMWINISVKKLTRA